MAVLIGRASDVGGDDVGSAPVQRRAGPLWCMVVRESACETASCTSRSGTPASGAASFRSRVSATVGIRVVPSPESTDLSSPRAKTGRAPWAERRRKPGPLGAVVLRGSGRNGLLW